MKKAVLVGINYESNPNARLYGCINDINNMGDLLVDAFGYRTENITKLRDDAQHASLLPTRANILTRLAQLVRDSANCEEIWFHYSGHGAQIYDRNGDERDGLDEIIVPVDYATNGIIIDDEIFNILRFSRCRTILLFDSCNSGTVCDLQWHFDYINNTQMRVLNTSRSLANPNIICYSGARDNQWAADAYSRDQRQAVGAFTHAFIACLRANNINVDALRLHIDVCAFLQRVGFPQVSTMSTSSAYPTIVFRRAGSQGEPARALNLSLNSVSTETKGVSRTIDLVVETPASPATPANTTVSNGINMRNILYSSEQSRTRHHDDTHHPNHVFGIHK